IIVSVFFGLFHFLNLLGGQALIPTVIQVYYATFLGGLFGYMFIKTKSLIPSIITHYLINSLGQLFLNAYFSDYASYALFAFFGIGIFPMIAGIILTKLITDLTSRSNR
ncbi:MAG: type II CAAX prenyl endopeptidase Rce1 family protein, partial [Candidatus Thorarchaeota archaeon]